jgi:hypothetical protein
MNNNKKEQK